MYRKIQYVIEMTYFAFVMFMYILKLVHDKFPPSVFDCQYADNFQKKILGQTRNFIEKMLICITCISI